MTVKLFHRNVEKIYVDTIVDEGTLNKNNTNFEIINLKGHTLASIGILTKEVLSQTKQDTLLGSLLDVHEAADEVE